MASGRFNGVRIAPRVVRGWPPDQANVHGVGIMGFVFNRIRITVLDVHEVCSCGANTITRWEARGKELPDMHAMRS